MSLADMFSGGSDSQAAEDLNRALEDLSGVATPSAQQLTLPQLQQYVQAGILTPEQAQAYIVNNNAFDNTTADNAGMQDELSTIGALQDIVNKGGNDAEEQSNIQGILNTLGTTESGNNAAILRDAAARGVSNSGTTLAARLASNQNDATNANANALGAAANAEQRQLGALSSAGQLGGQVQGQQYTQEANKANAANAIAQFNAQQQQDISKVNTTAANAVQAANLANAQDVANKNTSMTQMQEESVPAAQQQAFEDALSKATAETGIGESQANQQTQVGQQNAGILGGLIGAAGTVGSAYLSGNAYTALATAMASKATPNANVSTSQTNNSATPYVATGGRIMPGGVARPMNMKSGGPVPGMPLVPGDSPQNDVVNAKLSPGEIVLPRSVTQPAPDPNKVLQFLRSLPRPPAKPSVHPKAILDTLKALDMHHKGMPA